MTQNPFTIEKEAPMQGLQMLSQAFSKRGDYELAKTKEKKYMQLRKDLNEKMQTGTPEEVAEFVTLNPGAKQIADETIKFKSEKTKRSLVEGAKKRLMGEVDPVQSLKEHAGLVIKEGGDAKQSIGAVQEAMRDPKANEDADLKILAMYDKPAFDSLMELRTGTIDGKDTRTAEIKNWEYGLDNPEFAKAKQKADDSKLTEHELRLATMLANGEIDASQLPKRGNTYNKIVAGAKELNPELDIRSATADYALSKNPAFRQKTMTAEVLPDIMKHVVDAGKKVDFSNIKKIGGIQKLYKENINDPDFVEYMALRNDALMEIASVMRGGGMTDKAHEAEVEAMNPTMSPRALDAWIKAQNKALKPRLAIMRKIITGKGKPAPQTEGQTNDPLGIR